MSKTKTLRHRELMQLLAGRSFFDQAFLVFYKVLPAVSQGPKKGEFTPCSTSMPTRQSNARKLHSLSPQIAPSQIARPNSHHDLRSIA